MIALTATTTHLLRVSIGRPHTVHDRTASTVQSLGREIEAPRAVLFSRRQVPHTDATEIVQIAMIDLREWEIFRPYDILAYIDGIHRFQGSGLHRISVAYTNTELIRQRFVIGVVKTPADARSLGEVLEPKPGPLQRPECCNHAAIRGLLTHQSLRLFLHINDHRRILIQPDKEHRSPCADGKQMPQTWGERSEDAQHENRRNAGRSNT